MSITPDAPPAPQADPDAVDLEKRSPLDGLGELSDVTAQRDRRHGDALSEAAAAREPLTKEESQDLLDFYLSNNELPGDDEPLTLTTTLGHGKAERELGVTVHTILWEEWQDSRERATVKDVFDPFVSASWIVARALITPKLGPVVAAQQAEAQASADKMIEGPKGTRIPPAADAAHLLRRMFSKQSGALLELSGKVLGISKLQDGVSSVREVEAGKD